jgi:hypothetical protein
LRPATVNRLRFVPYVRSVGLSLVDQGNNVQGYVAISGDRNQLILKAIHRPRNTYAGELRFTPEIRFGNRAFACRTRLDADPTVVQMASGPADSLLNDYYRSRWAPNYQLIDRKRCPKAPTGWMAWNVYFDAATENDDIPAPYVFEKAEAEDADIESAVADSVLSVKLQRNTSGHAKLHLTFSKK